MNKKFDLKKIAVLLNETLVLGIVFFVPLFFAFDMKTNNVFLLNKVVLFKILVTLLLFFSIFKLVFYLKEISFNKIFDKVKKNKAILAIIFLYFIFLTISTIFSQYKEISFWGTYDNQLGLETSFYLLLFFILTFLNLDSKKSIYRILKTLLFSSFFVSVYAIVQASGHDPLHWVESTKLRVVSTFGQPNFLGAFLLLVIPLNIYLVKKTQNNSRYIYLFILFLNILTLGFTYSIASWLGFFSAIFLFLVYLLKQKSKIYLGRKKITIFFVFFVVVLLLVSNSSIFKTKVTTAFNLNSGSTAARIDFWQASLKGIKEKPIFGYGLETQGETIPKYYQNDWAIHSNIGIRPEKAHNLILDTLLAGGIFGFVSYLLLLFIFFRTIFLNIKNGKESFLNVSIAIAFTSYLVYLLFNYTFIVAEIIFWLYFAIILKINLSQEIKLETKSIKKNFQLKKINAPLLFLIIIIFAYLLFNLAKKEIDILIADKYYFDIQVARVNNEYFKALLLYDYIKKLEPPTNVYDVKFGQILSEWTPQIEKYGKVFSHTGTLYMKSIIDNTKGNKYEDMLAKANMLAYISVGDEAYFPKAEKEYQDLIDVYPGQPRAYYKFANFYFKNAHYAEAEDMAMTALDKIPDTDNQYLNSDHLNKINSELFINYLLLGEIFEKKEEYDKSQKFFKKASSRIESSIVYSKLANLFKEKGDFEKAIWYNKKAIELDENNHLLYYYLADTYYKNANYEDALIEINKSLDIFAEFPEAINLKEVIEKELEKLQ